MSYIKYPENAFFYNLSLVDNAIFLCLLQHHFHFCSGDYDQGFYLTDRHLAEITGCSLRSVWKSKKKLYNCELIIFSRGLKNKTFYKIVSDNNKPLLYKKNNGNKLLKNQ